MKGGAANVDHLECVNCAGSHSELLKQTTQLQMDQASLSGKEHCLTMSSGQGGCGKKKRRKRRRKRKTKKRKSRRKSKSKKKKAKRKTKRRKKK